MVKIDLARLAELVAQQPVASLRELRERLGNVCSESAVCMALGRLGLSYKKDDPRSGAASADVAARREQWRVATSVIDASRLIFIDESCAKTNMTRLRGRARIGERLIDKTPHGHWKTTSLIAALGIAGMRCSTVVDGAVNADVFEAFVEQVLIPELPLGDVVILDNLSSHKSEQTRKLIESRGARLEFLPPYPPDLNLIEMVFAKVKQLLRSMACRTRDALWTAMQSVLDTANCFRHCGYTLHEN